MARTQEEIDKDYTDHLIQIGYRRHTISRNEAEIDALLMRCNDITNESKLLTETKKKALADAEAAKVAELMAQEAEEHA